MFGFLGRFGQRHRRVVLVAAVLFTVMAGLWGGGVFSALSGSGYDDPSAESSRAVTFIEENFGRQGTEDVAAVYRDPSGALAAGDPRFTSRVRAVIDALPRSHVLEAVGPWTPGQSAQERAERVSRDGRALKVSLTLAGDEKQRFDNYTDIKDRLHVQGLETNLAGQVAGIDQLGEAATGDLGRTEAIALPILLVLLVLLFRGVVAGLLPLVLGVLSIVGAMALLRAINSVTEVSVLALNIATFLGLGLAIDYGLFMVSRFREELAAGRDVPDAVRVTVATAGRTVAFSGLVIVIAFSGMLFFPSAAYRSFGWGGISVVLFDVLAALIVLPALLAVLGRRVDALRVPLGRRRRTAASPATNGAQDGTDGWWAGLARRVMRRPLVWMLAAGAVLVVAGLPIASLQPGVTNHRYLPPGSEDIVATTMLERDFPAERGTYHLEVAVDGTVARPDLERYAAGLARLDGAFSAEVTAAEPGAAHLRVGVRGEPDTRRNLQLAEDVRAQPSPPGADRVLVGGQAPRILDSVESFRDFMPWALLLVCVLTFVVLFCAFGSVVLPVKALLAAFLSLGASVGVIVWGMQEGAIASPLGFDPAGTTDLANLMILLLIVFGLATDYELFLLSRVREEYLATGDNAHSVAVGLQRTGSIITSAAVLLGVVLALMGLVSSGLVLTTMGVGMTVAIAVDATLVRIILVPATMRLLGRANWWLPGPLRGLHDRIGFSEPPTADRGTPAAGDEAVIMR